jgi:YD repeat-containing protein
MKTLKLTKLYFILLFVFSSTHIVFSQDGTNPSTPGYASLNLNSELQNRISFPKSPEAAAFEKYGDIPVDMHSGSTNIELPLHTIKGKEFEVPMSLTYDATGIKVIDNSSIAGLGWNLRVGGRITRIVNGLPDDNAVTSPFYNETIDADFEVIFNNIGNAFYDSASLVEYHELLKSMKNNCKDLLYDVYSLNVIGLNDYIFIGQDGVPRTLVNPNISVTKDDNETWIVTDEVGTKYFFGQNYNYETTETTGNSDMGSVPCASGPISSISSWLVTKIVSKNGFDVFDFTYNSYSWSDKVPFVKSQSARNFVNHLNNMSITGITNNYDGEFKNTQKCLNQIMLNNGLMVDFSYKARTDINFTNSIGNALNKINVYKFNHDTQNGTYTNPILKTVTFNHSYFGGIQASILNQRLKLNNFIISSTENLNDNQVYGFEYYEQYQLPPKNSFAQDQLGLYNGANFNTSLIGQMRVGLNILSGANREFDLVRAISGTLKKIIYPSKGYTEFVYEQHDADTPTPINQQIDYINISSNYITYNNRYDYIHSGMLNDGATGVNTMLMTIPESGVYKIQCGGNAIWYIHKPLCLDNLDPSSSYIEQSINNQASFTDITNPLAIVPSCVNVELKPTVDIYTVPGQATNGVSGYTMPVSQTVSLQAGQYQVTVWGKEEQDGGPGGPSGIAQTSNPPTPTHIRIYKDILVYPYSDLIPGFRVQRIDNYDHTGLVQNSKKYQYKTQINGAISSGRKSESVTSKHSYYFVTTIVPTEGCPSQTYEQLNIIRYSSGIENSPHVQYSNVFEIEENNGVNNGYIKHVFTCDTSPTGLASNQGVKSYKRKSLVGKEYSTQFFNNENIKLSEIEYNYNYNNITYDTKYFGGLSSVTDYSHIDDMKWWYRCQSNNNSLMINDTKLVLRGFLGSTAGTPCTMMLQLPEYVSSTWPTLCQNSGNIEEFGVTSTVGEYANRQEWSNFYIDDRAILSSKRKTSFTNQYPNTIVEQETYTYNDGGFLENKINAKTIGSFPNFSVVDGIKTQYLYNTDIYECNPEKISNETTSRIENSIETKLFEKEYIYGDYGSRNGMLVNSVNEVKAAKENRPIETRLKYNYNMADTSDGNLNESVVYNSATDATNSYESYIFGYNDRYPVAKLTGVKYNQISATKINAIKTKSNKIITPTNEQDLINELNGLRTDFPDAQITTYTYNPVIGVTSITDPKGDVQYYFYDELGRLKEVKDKNGNKLSENEYHYRP